GDGCVVAVARGGGAGAAGGEAGDVVDARQELRAQLERRVDRGVTEPAARIELWPKAALDDVEFLAEIVERRERDLEPAGERLEVAVGPFERGWVGGETALAEQRRHQAVARRLAGMQRLGHGAEVGGDAAGERGADSDHGGER